MANLKNTIISGSTAITGSWNLVGNLTINGNVQITGSVDITGSLLLNGTTPGGGGVASLSASVSTISPTYSSSITLTATASNFTPSTYTWYANGVQIGTGASLVWTVNISGAITITCVATDNTLTAMNTLLINVQGGSFVWVHDRVNWQTPVAGPNQTNSVDSEGNFRSAYPNACYALCSGVVGLSWMPNMVMRDAFEVSFWFQSVNTSDQRASSIWIRQQINNNALSVYESNVNTFNLNMLYSNATDWISKKLEIIRGADDKIRLYRDGTMLFTTTQTLSGDIYPCVGSPTLGYQNSQKVAQVRVNKYN